MFRNRFITSLVAAVYIGGFFTSMFLMGCIQRESQVEATEKPYVECPARLMTDTDELWICAFDTGDGKVDDVTELMFPSDLNCTFVDCHTAKCNGGVYECLRPDAGPLTGVLKVGDRRIEFTCF